MLEQQPGSGNSAGTGLKTWHKILLTTLVTLALGGLYLFSVWQHRRNPGVIANHSLDQNLTPDDVAVVRKMFMTSFSDTLVLQGKSVWMKNGYTMPYFPFKGGRIVFAKRVGLIPAAQKLDVKKIVKALPPASVDDGIDHGSRQVFAVFALPGAPALYATPIGVINGSQEQYYCDMLFYYDDPHTIYDNWPKDVWAAIDGHQVKPGMTELETRMSIGQKLQSEGGSEGNRIVTYDQAGKHWTIRYTQDRATSISTQ
ncbi:MAG TPA: hypothetical protein VHX20_09085 [Terracidiphilus sp.]|jgi:hypothetical protein|nr:hypothetical protein [Terracidiphilus sp.]